MPDLHQGKFPVGSVVITEPNFIYPELVGPDIGCGMSLIKTSININKLSPKQLERIAGQINIGNFVFNHNYTEQTHREKYYSNNILIGTDIINSPPVDSTWLSQYKTDIQSDIFKISQLIDDLGVKYLNSMGTIGLGNHFVELLTLDKIKSEELVSKYSINSDYYYILVHSGSRGLGEEILQMFQSNKISITEYKIFHDYAIDWAKHNRFAIATQFASYIGTKFEYIVDLTHNWVEEKQIDYEIYNIHRKGAAPAYYSPIVIPGSRGTSTWFVEPNQFIQSLKTGFSVSHGACRKISRAKAQEGMKNKTVKDRDICCQGDIDISNIVICQDVNLFYEEAPFAYKDIQAVIDDLEHFELVTPICSFIPSITFKCKK
jgi:release factor H-coupled RctB family protein